MADQHERERAVLAKAQELSALLSDFAVQTAQPSTALIACDCPFIEHNHSVKVFHTAECSARMRWRCQAPDCAETAVHMRTCYAHVPLGELERCVESLRELVAQRIEKERPILKLNLCTVEDCYKPRNPSDLADTCGQHTWARYCAFKISLPDQEYCNVLTDGHKYCRHHTVIADTDAAIAKMPPVLYLCPVENCGKSCEQGYTCGRHPLVRTCDYASCTVRTEGVKYCSYHAKKIGYTHFQQFQQTYRPTEAGFQFRYHTPNSPHAPLRLERIAKFGCACPPGTFDAAGKSDDPPTYHLRGCPKFGVFTPSDPPAKET